VQRVDRSVKHTIDRYRVPSKYREETKYQKSSRDPEVEDKVLDSEDDLDQYPDSIIQSS
jgi:hypothetical protein